MRLTLTEFVTLDGSARLAQSHLTTGLARYGTYDGVGDKLGRLSGGPRPAGSRR
jgi:hypothetical protein